MQICTFFLCIVLFFGCSNQEEERQRLALDVERIVLEHERFVQDIDRYHQERERIEGRTNKLILGIFLSMWFTDSATSLIGQARQIAEDASQFPPEALRLYKEGERIAWDLRRAYERRDLLVPEEQHLTVERTRLAEDLVEKYQTVDFIEQETLQITQTYMDVCEEYEQASTALEAWEQENEHKYNQIKQEQKELERIYKNLGREYDIALQKKEIAKRVYDLTKRTYDADDLFGDDDFDFSGKGNFSAQDSVNSERLPDKYWEAHKSYTSANKVFLEISESRRKAGDALVKSLNSFKSYLEAKRDHPTIQAYDKAQKAYEQTKQEFEQTSQRLEEDLERAYLDWDWLTPYLDRLIRDLGLQMPRSRTPRG